MSRKGIKVAGCYNGRNKWKWQAKCDERSEGLCQGNGQKKAGTSSKNLKWEIHGNGVNMLICGQICSCQLDGSGARFKAMARVRPSLSAWGSPLRNPLLITRLTFAARFRWLPRIPLPPIVPPSNFHFSGSGLMHSQNLSLSHARKINKMQATAVTLAMTTSPNSGNNTPLLHLAKCLMSDRETDKHWEKLLKFIY